MTMKVGKDHKVPLSPCTNCRYEMDAVTGISETEDDITPDSGAFTICIKCGHIMAFTDDLTLRDLTEEEIVKVAGDKRILVLQWAREQVMRDRARVEDMVRAKARKEGTFFTHEKFNELVDVILMTRPPRRGPW